MAMWDSSLVTPVAPHLKDPDRSAGVSKCSVRGGPATPVENVARSAILAH